MPRKKRRFTPLQQEYKKQQNRLKQAIRRAEKKGYVFQENIIPELPKRVTRKALQSIKELKPKSLYKKAVKLDIETGEITPGLEARKKERKEAVKKAKRTKKIKEEIQKQKITTEYPSFSKIIISNFLAEVSRFPEVAYPLFKRWIEDLLTQYSEDDVARMLETAKNDGVFPDYSVAYRRDLILSRIADMTSFLDTSQGFKDEIIEALEYSEDWEQI